MDCDRTMNKLVKTFIIILLAYATFFWLINPMLLNASEGFESQTEVSNMEQENQNIVTEQPVEVDNVGSFDSSYMQEMNIPIGISDSDIPDNLYFLDDGANGEMGLHNNLCSKSCCSDQYPTPFKLNPDKSVCENKGEFVPNNIMCNNAYQDSGCLCLTKKQAKFLGNRGGNA